MVVLADHASSHREGWILAALVALVVCVVGGLMVVAAVLATQPGNVRNSAPQQPMTTMEPVKPVSETVAPAPTGRRVAQAWVATESARTGISAVAVDAYGGAALRLAHKQPGCHVGWTTLAAIGGIESGHGTNGGAYLQADGTTSHPILGPSLDGSAGMGAIRSDQESVRWHGDTRWDHAVGPMQFIPSTWRTWGADANGDGKADPNNIVDAAYTAGLYLCASGADLRTGAGWTQAIFSYNHSDDYVRAVLARANLYGSD
jgi:membrane-bound lytic murein transglycosylase B